MTIITMARIKPSNNISYVKNSNNVIFVKEVKKDVFFKTKVTKKKFIFDYVFGKEDDNIIIFENVWTQIIKDLLNGISNIFYVFGQTGSGKTYTIFGTKENNGLIDLLFQNLNEKKIFFKINCIEIYNDKCYDLLNKNIFIEENEFNDNICFRNITEEEVNNSNYKIIIKKIMNNRSVGKSSRNDSSSRSHIIIVIKLENCYFKIVDIAGSEKAKDALFDCKIAHRENCEINKAIFALKECIRSIKNNSKFIPYRRCKLTKLLKESFENRVKTYILGNVSEEYKNLGDTINTLGYILDIKKVNKIQLLKLEDNNLLKDRLQNLFIKKFDLDLKFVKEHKSILDNFKLKNKLNCNKLKYIINDEISILNKIKNIDT